MVELSLQCGRLVRGKKEKKKKQTKNKQIRKAITVRGKRQANQGQ